MRIRFSLLLVALSCSSDVSRTRSSIATAAVTLEPRTVGPTTRPPAPVEEPIPEVAGVRLAPMTTLSTEATRCVLAHPRPPGSTYRLPKGALQVNVIWAFNHASQGSPTLANPMEQPLQMGRLRIQAKGFDHTIPLGEAAGNLLGLDQTVCENAPRGHGICARAAPPRRAPQEGVVASSALVATYGYLTTDSTTWMVARTHDALIILRHHLGFDRPDLCEPDDFDVLAVVEQVERLPVHEATLVSTPTEHELRPLDCAAAWARDGRCTG